MSNKKFTRTAKDFGLTYAEAGQTDKLGIYHDLSMLMIGGEMADKIMLCEEVGHKSGRRHYHAYIHFPKKVRVDENSFDIQGLKCHIDRVKRAGPRSILPMLKYLTKEDKCPIANFDYMKDLEEKETNSTTKRKPDWDGYFAQGLTQGEVFEALANEGFSADFADHFTQWNGYIKRRYIENRKEIYQPDPNQIFILPEALAMWKMCNFDGWRTWCATNNEWERPRSLILIGESRSGKTQWARSLGHHMYFCNLLNLDLWDETADYIVLDDFNSDITKFFPAWKCFFGGQREFTLTDKYRGKKTVKWGKPCIWLSNEDIFKNLNIEHINFIKKNCEVIVLNKKLY